jgi:hypothetical protein
MDDLLDLDELRAFAPPPPVRPLPPERLAQRKEFLMRAVERSLGSTEASTTLPEPARDRARRPRRRRRVTILIAAAVAVVGSTALGWALLSSARDTVAVECVIEGTDTIIPAASGDPVADCAAQWQRDTGNPAPPLTAYDNGVGGVTVLPASQTPPPSYSPLPNGTVQNVAMVQMQQWLDDYVVGLNSGCFGDATAVPMTEQALVRFGLVGWTVVPAPQRDRAASASQPVPTGQQAPVARQDDGQLCVNVGILDASSTTVTLMVSSGPGPGGSTEQQLAAALRPIAQQCLPLDEAARQVRSAADALGLSEDARDYELTEVPDPAADCTTITENVGGTIFLVLRGPASS